MAIILFLNLLGCKKENASISPIPTVSVEKNKGEFRLIRNGKAFYIKGGASHPDYLQELKDAGANTVRIYDTINLTKTLNAAEALGLAVVVDLPMPSFKSFPYFYEDPVRFEKIKTSIERTVNLHKYHPALLYWNLGNEIKYPSFYKRSNFFSNYNSLIKSLKEIDPNHPISTTLNHPNKLKILSIHRKSPDLDFISFNIFGVLSKLENKIKPIEPIWSGPYVISEWGSNGPWEVENTIWGAPIEETSTKKAEQIKNRYYDFIKPLKNKNSFGSFVFYFSRKNEDTPTWFSFFGTDNLKTQAVFEMSQIWKSTDSIFKGPTLSYILLNGKGAGENIILSSSTPAEVEVVKPESRNSTVKYSGEVRKESWIDGEVSEIVNKIKFRVQDNIIFFNTPEKEGPYRIFVYLTDGSEYYATANIPFYVLNPEDGEL